MRLPRIHVSSSWRFALRAAACGAAFLLLLSAQGLNPAKLLAPPTDTWPTYNGDYSGRRFSTLKQINAGNIGSLALAWMYRINVGAMRGVGSVEIKSTPLAVNGVLYFTRARAKRSGTTTGLIRAAICSATAVLACTETGSISFRPMVGSFR